MELTNQQIRSQKIGQFALLYGSIVILLLLILYFSARYIPSLYHRQQQMNKQEMESFVLDADKIHKQVDKLDAAPVLNESLLDTTYALINQLKGNYPDSVYQKVLMSYQTMIGQLDNAKKHGDPELNTLDQQQQQLISKKNALLVAIGKTKPVPGSTPPPNKNTPPPPPSKGGTVAAQDWGPYYPKLLKGDGSFGDATPYIKVNLWLTADENVVTMHVYFEASFNQFSSSGIDSKIETQEVLYMAPAGTKIDPSTLPIKDGFVYAYRDKTNDDETVTSPDGTFTCQMKGNTLYPIGDPKSSQLKIKLNHPLIIGLIK